MLRTLLQQTLNGGLTQWVGNGYAQNINNLITRLERLLVILKDVKACIDTSKKNDGCMGDYWLKDETKEETEMLTDHSHELFKLLPEITGYTEDGDYVSKGLKT